MDYGDDWMDTSIDDCVSDVFTPKGREDQSFEVPVQASDEESVDDIPLIQYQRKLRESQRSENDEHALEDPVLKESVVKQSLGVKQKLVIQKSKFPSTKKSTSALKKKKTIRDCIQKFHARRLDNLLASNGYYRFEVESDGDCFFKAALHQLGSEYTGHSLRIAASVHLLEHKPHYMHFLETSDCMSHQSDFEHEVTKIQQPGIWNTVMGDIVPLAIANILSRPLKIFSSQISNPIIDVLPSLKPAGVSAQTINLAFLKIPGNEHYDAVTKIDRTKAHNQQQTKRPNGNYEITTPAKRTAAGAKSQIQITPHKDATYESPDEKNHTRKRKSTPLNWKRNIRRQKRAYGHEYVSQRGKVVSKRSIQTVDCSHCRFKCSLAVNEEARQTIFNTYWTFGDYVRQRDFLCRYVMAEKPKRCKGHKSLSYKFYMPLETENKRVCQTFFLKTLDIGKGTVYKALSEKLSGSFVGTDMRGKQPSANKTSPEAIAFIKEHIESFPTMESHYTRKTSKRKYLSHDLNIRKMWQLYSDCAIKKGFNPVKEKTYRDFFCKHYNLSFFTPKKDQCSLCNLYEQKKQKNCLDATLTEKYEQHQQRRVEAIAEKEKDKQKSQNKGYYAATFDLQAVLTTPCSLVGALYYKRKLSCYNLSFYSLGDKNGTCFLWNETEGGHGSCEVASCIMMQCNSVASKYSAVRDITFYSDTCGGQNRKKFVAASLLYTIFKIESLDRLNLKFFEIGHSHMESDSIHSTIERMKKNIPVYVPSQWNTVVSLARRGHPYIVAPLKFDDFLDVKAFCKSCCPNMRKSNLGILINWSKIRWIQVRRGCPESIFVNYGFDSDTFQEIKVTESSWQQPEEFPRSMGQLYLTKRPISEVKKRDLISLCESAIIPEDFHQYYHALPTDRSIKDKVLLPDFDDSDDETDSD